MPRNKVRSLRCPTCRKIVLRDEPEFPFCSERCRLIDLGKWASGGYVISTPMHEANPFGDADYTIPNPSSSQRRPAPQNRRDDKDKH